MFLQCRVLVDQLYAMGLLIFGQMSDRLGIQAFCPHKWDYDSSVGFADSSLEVIDHRYLAQLDAAQDRLVQKCVLRFRAVQFQALERGETAGQAGRIG